jgi:magnesium transporter
MLNLYIASDQGLQPYEHGLEFGLPPNVVWIDMLQPTPEEERAVEGLLDLNVPTREELQEIEVSSRLYKEAGALFMTATVIAQADTPRPGTTAVTFVLVNERLVTVRYATLQPFSTFLARQQREEHPPYNGEVVLLGMLDAIVDRVADLLERIGGELDAVSREIFNRDGAGGRREGSLQDALQRLGRSGDMTSKVSESLVSLARLVAFLAQAEERLEGEETAGLLEMLDRDVKSLSSHAQSLSNKVTFLLSATLGMVNIEQTDIIKIFSVAAVMFLPPTLVASIYGMNFEFMPELHWTLGYPFAIGLMVVSALLPYRFFKKRGWL